MDETADAGEERTGAGRGEEEEQGRKRKLRIFFFWTGAINKFVGRWGKEKKTLSGQDGTVMR